MIMIMIIIIMKIKINNDQQIMVGNKVLRSRICVRRSRMVGRYFSLFVFFRRWNRCKSAGKRRMFIDP